MFRSVLRCGTIFRPGRLCMAAAVFGGLALSGCANLGYRGEQFQYDPAFELGSQYRPFDRSIEPAAVTNKSLQIERNLGVR